MCGRKTQPHSAPSTPASLLVRPDVSQLSALWPCIWHAPGRGRRGPGNKARADSRGAQRSWPSLTRSPHPTRHHRNPRPRRHAGARCNQREEMSSRYFGLFTRTSMPQQCQVRGLRSLHTDFGATTSDSRTSMESLPADRTSSRTSETSAVTAQRLRCS